MLLPRPLATLVLSLIFLCLLSATALAVGDDWKPIDAAELALKEAAVEKDADAEALFWEVRVDDGDPGELVFSNYVRVKIFTERGKESQSKIDLQYFSDYKLKDIAARTIKPDGSVVELAKDDIHERTIVKTNGVKVKAKSFAMPGVEPGSIIEYRWREVRPNVEANFVDLQFQRDVPVQSVTYLVRPYSGETRGMSYRPFHLPRDVKFEKAKNGFYRISLTNVPAFREEPRMPPEDEVRSWVLLFYSSNQDTSPDKYWNELGKRFYDATKDDMKVNDDVRRAATEIIGDASTPDDKLKRLYEYCQTKIKNISNDHAMTAEEKAKLKENKTPADTLKRGMGKGSNIDYLFAALANAAGLEAHLALSGNRQNIFLDQKFTNPYFLLRGSSFIAVHVGDKWEFFSPSESYTPFGMLGWREEADEALVISKEPTWVKTPLSGPEKSMQKSKGKFRLDEDGTLEGDVHVEYTGQMAIDRKYQSDDDSPAQREDTLRTLIKQRMSTAELTNIKIENVTDPMKPLLYEYHLRVPGYAQRTGKRVFLQPAVFQRGLGSVFSASNRKNAVYFYYPWSEEDEITIELPTGYALDNADAPAPFSGGVVSQYKPTVAVSNDGKFLIYKRKFFFGGGGSLLFPSSSYGQLKVYFDTVQKEDGHTITLKQSATSAIK